ncbi:MAG: pimeloyl-ACP methyl ester carboxylesterase [Candidatus Poriferisodalaceae bacterium]|jgi:pimeloyl-ACP methyl ester carboxylesterase
MSYQSDAAYRIETVSTKRGLTTPVRVYGHGPIDVLYLHGAGGLLPVEATLDALVAAELCVAAPLWPGYSEHEDEHLLEDMLDFALHGWDVVNELGLEKPSIVGHSMGGMIAAEMAAIAPQSVDRLGLLCPAGMWIDEHPIPDLFSMLPFEMAEVLFADPVAGEKMLAAGMDFSDDKALTDFMVARARQLGMAGKILFPVPNRRLSKRAYRIYNPTILVWGNQDRLIPPVYAGAFEAAIANTSTVFVDGAGHMLPHEQPAAVAEALVNHLG